MDPFHRLTIAQLIAHQIASPTLIRIRQALKHWEKQRTYDGPSWYGIEQFHRALARAVERTTVEAAGWYKYPSSNRPDMDGKDWRLIVPDGIDRAVVINCHSLLHDDVWTLQTTIYPTADVDLDPTRLIGDPNPWVRTLLWTQTVAEALETSDYDYSQTKADLDRRLELTDQAQTIAARLITKTLEAFANVTGSLAETPSLYVGVSPVNLDTLGKIGAHESPNEVTPYSVITVHPKVFDRPGFINHVIQHELIHSVINSNGVTPHGKLFNRMAERLGLPKEMRD